MGVEDEYAAFCFDEACVFILGRMKGGKGETPRWSEERGIAGGDAIEFLKGFGKG